MSSTPYINFTHPANAPILAYLHIDTPESAQTYAPDQVGWMALGTHPDLVEHLWNMGKAVDADTPCVINLRSSPLVTHPKTGVIFAMAGGTHTMALRLPEPEYSEMMQVPKYGAMFEYTHGTVYAKDMGEDWVLVETFGTRNPDLIRRAYEYAGTL